MDVDFTVDKKGKVTYRISEDTSSGSMASNGVSSSNYLSRIPQSVDPTMLNIWGLNKSSFISAARMSTNANTSTDQVSDARLSTNDKMKPEKYGNTANQKFSPPKTDDVRLGRSSPGRKSSEKSLFQKTDSGQGDSSLSKCRVTESTATPAAKIETDSTKRYTNFASINKNAKSKPDSHRSNMGDSNRDPNEESRIESQRSLRDIYAERIGAVTFKSGSSQDWVVRTSVLGKGTTVHRVCEPPPSLNYQTTMNAQSASSELTKKMESVQLNDGTGKSAIGSVKDVNVNPGYDEKVEPNQIESQIKQDTSSGNIGNKSNLERKIETSYMSQRTLELCKNDPYLASLLLKATNGQGLGSSKSEQPTSNGVELNEKSSNGVPTEVEAFRKSPDTNSTTSVSSLSQTSSRRSLDSGSANSKIAPSHNSETPETIFDHVKVENFSEKHPKGFITDELSKGEFKADEQKLTFESVDSSKSPTTPADDAPLTYRPIGRSVKSLLRDSLDSEDDFPVSEKDGNAGESASKNESNDMNTMKKQITIDDEEPPISSGFPKTPCSSGRKVTFRDRISSDSSNLSDSVYGIPKRKPNERKSDDTTSSKNKSGNVPVSRSKSEEKLIAQAAVIGKSIKTNTCRKGSDSSDDKEFEKFWNVSLEEWKKLSPYQKYLKYKKMSGPQKDELLNPTSGSKFSKFFDSDSDAFGSAKPTPRKPDHRREEIKLLYPKKSKKDSENPNSSKVSQNTPEGVVMFTPSSKKGKEVIGKVLNRHQSGPSKKTFLQDTDDDDKLLNRDKETFRSGSFDKLVEGFLFSSKARKSEMEDDKLNKLESAVSTDVKKNSKVSNDLEKVKKSSNSFASPLNTKESTVETRKSSECKTRKPPHKETTTERDHETTPAWSEPFPDSLVLETYRPDENTHNLVEEDENIEMNDTNVSLSTLMPETRRSISEAFKQTAPDKNVSFDETTQNDQFAEFVFLCRNNAQCNRCDSDIPDAALDDNDDKETREVVTSGTDTSKNGSVSLELEALRSCESLIESLYDEPEVKITPVRYIGSHAKKHLELSNNKSDGPKTFRVESLPDDGMTFKQFIEGDVSSTKTDRQTLEDLDEFVVSKFGGQTVRDMTENKLVSKSLLLESVDAEMQTSSVQTTFVQPYFAQPANFKKGTDENKVTGGKTSSDQRLKSERRRSSRSPRRAGSSSRSPRHSKTRDQNQANVSAVQSRNPQTGSLDVNRGASAVGGSQEKRKSGAPQNARTGAVGNKQQSNHDKVNNSGHAANLAMQLQRSFPQNITKQSRVEDVSEGLVSSNSVAVKEAPKINDRTARNTPSPQLYPRPNLRNKPVSPQLVRPSSARQKRNRSTKGDPNRGNMLQAQGSLSRSISPAVHSRSRTPSPSRSNVSNQSSVAPPAKPVSREEHFSQYLQELHASLAQRNMLTSPSTVLTSASTREICGDLLATPKESKGPSKNMWLSLPTEIWLFIMSFLAPHNLNYLGQTCKKLKHLAFDFTLWASVTVSKKTLKPPHFKSIVSLNPTCVSFLQCEFEGIKDQNLRELFRSLRDSLQELNIVGCNSKECNANSILVHAGTRCPKLINLDTSWSNLNPHTLVAFSEYVDHLESLSLNGCSAINDDCITKLMEKYGQSLKKMYLYGCYKLDSSLRSMSDVLPNLQVVHLGNVPLVTDEILHKFATSLRDLREVDVRSNKNITDEGIYNLAFYCRRLQVLIIPNCPQISNYALFHLGGYCMNLSVLDLDGCSKISDEGVEKLICGTRVIIYKLGLSSTGVTNASCKMISENCANLQEIKFSFCHANISVDSLKALVETKPDLSTIHLYGFDKARVKKALKGVNKGLKINI